MNTIKRISAIVLSFVMIMSCSFSAVVFADAAFTDVDATNQYATAIEDLVNKNIINGYDNNDGTFSFKPDGEITRAEFAKIIAVANAPKDHVFAPQVSSFSDVPAGHWAIPYIEYAVKTKIVNGMGDGTFAPGNPVTYEQAVKMVVCAIGYGNVITPAPEGTPWYQPYIEIATRINITKGAFSPVGTNAARGLVAQLVYNMNRTAPIVQTGVDQFGAPTWGTADGTSEEINKSVKQVSGQVVSVFDRKLRTELSNSKNGEICVMSGNTEYVFKMGKYEADTLYDLIGYEVNIEYSEDNSGKYVLENIRQSSSNKVYTINDIDIIDVTENYIEYFDNDKEAKLSLDRNKAALKNGGPIDMTDFVTEATVANGQLRLLDSNGDAVIDVVFIDSYDVYFVSSAFKTNGVYNIYDKFDSTKKLQLDEDLVDINVKISTNSAEKLTDASASALTSTANSVLWVMEAQDGSDRVDIIISKRTVSGSTAQSEVKEIREGLYVKFGKEIVYMSDYYKDNLENPAANQEIEIGQSYSAHLDHLGRLVAVNKAITTFSYGYITMVGSTTESMGEEQHLVRMYDTNGRMYDKLPVASKSFKLNGVNADAEDLKAAVEAAAAVSNAGKDTDENGDNTAKHKNVTQAALVKYEIKDNELKSVYLVDAETNTSSDDYIDAAIHPKYIAGTTSLRYNSASNSFRGDGTSFTISSSTKVIFVPNDRLSSTGYKFRTGTSEFSNGDEYLIDAYDVSGTSPAKVVVVYGSTPSIKATADTILVKSVDEEYNETTKEIEKTLRYYKLGSGDKEFTAKGETDNTFDGVEKGDIIRFIITGNVVEKVEIVLDQSTETINNENYTNASYPGALYHEKGGTYIAVYGTLMKKPVVIGSTDGHVDNTIGVSATGNEEDTIQFTVSSSTTTPTPVLKYDSTNEEFVFGLTEHDLIDVNPDPTLASKVFMARKSNVGNVQAVIIYE